MGSMPARASSNSVFISYSHADRKWLDRLLENVRPLVREGHIQVFSDKDIMVGADWRSEIQAALNAASIAVLLIMNEELPHLLAGAADKGTIIIPVIVTPSLFETMPSLSRFQAANSPSKPLSAMRPSEWQKVLVDLAREIQRRITGQSILRSDYNSRQFMAVS
jgi:TIR domain